MESRAKAALTEAIKSDSSAVPVAEQILRRPSSTVLNWRTSIVPEPLLGKHYGSIWKLELLFSCLVDADWSDTSEHDRKVNGWEKDPEPPTHYT